MSPHPLAEQLGLRGIEFHDEIGSTNDRALELAAAGHDRLPWVVWADRQTSGRGRGANRWWSGPGALTFSLMAVPATPQPRGAPAAWTSLVAGLAVLESLRPFAPASDFRLKWPNDVYLDGRKVCGILVEVPPPPGRGVIVGVGINVNNSLADAPDALRATATSLSDAVGHALDREVVLEAALKSLLVELAAAGESADRLRERWAGCCHLTGRIVQLESLGATTTGLCLGIDSDGALLLQSERGPSRHLSGVVRRID